MRGIKPKTRCVNCLENNLHPEGREWCLNNCQRAWEIDTEPPKERTYPELRKATRDYGGWPTRSIECLDDGKVYESAKALAEILGCTESAICNCCRGRARTVKGFQFRYVGDTTREWKPPVIKPTTSRVGHRGAYRIKDMKTKRIYKSTADAAMLLGVGKTTLYHNLALPDNHPMKRFEYVKEAK